MSKTWKKEKYIHYLPVSLLKEKKSYTKKFAHVTSILINIFY
jgi:hypothetical protein